MVRYGDEVEADLRHFYGVDLLDLWRGTLSLRQLLMFIRKMPRESELRKAINDGDEPWSRLEVLVSDLWVITGKARWGKKAPDAHPLRAVAAKKRSSVRKNARKAALARASEKRARRRKVAGR